MEEAQEELEMERERQGLTLVHFPAQRKHSKV
jgi:hypothetical protein